jgi:hypothetical protein
LNGTAKPGTAVTIVGTDTGATREITADSSGRFSFGQLAPGTYTVTSGGVTRTVEVRVGTGSTVNLTDASLGTVTVSGGASINPIDVSSVESTTVFTAEQINKLPVGRDPTNVALLAPGTVKGDTGFGNLASFGGSSVAENGYYINGFDVTNIFNFVSYANLPFDAIGEQQIKTGGYGAEFGRSLGGVINIVTKRGTNEWKGGFSVYWTPEALREHSSNVLSNDPADIASGDKYFVYREDNSANALNYNIYGGGPIVKDRLFMFALLEGQDNSSDAYGKDTSQHLHEDQPNGLIKIDWNITNNHILELTGITNRSNVDVVNYTNTLDTNGDRIRYTGEHGDEFSRYKVKNGGDTYIAKYTGYLTDNFTLSAQYGQLKNVVGERDPLLLGTEECPRAYDSRANAGQTVYVGCYDEINPFRRDASAPTDEDKRKAWRIDAEWRLGDHLVRFGYDHEQFDSSRAGQEYSGGIYYRYFRTTSTQTVNGVSLPGGTDYVRTWDYRTLSGAFRVINTAFYVEDSWQITDNVLLYGGIRGESFENRNGDGVAFVKSDTLYAPRLGFSWDVNGDSTLKVFGNAGRYYIPVAANTNVRASGAENRAVNYYHYSGEIAADGSPVGGLGTIIGNLDTSVPVAPDPRTVAANNLTPMYQDEFIAGLQRQVGQNWTFGVRAIARRVKNGMDDYCGHQAWQDWADDNGYTNANLQAQGYGGTTATCVVINPGQDVEIAFDLENDGNLTVVTVPNSYLKLPKYQRKYNALEFFFERAMADNWYIQGSYTLASSKGNAEGYVNSTLEQIDAGLTQDFDHKLFEDGAYGFLPNDRRHTFKLFGVYQLNDEWRLGGSFLLQSGRPRNCNGFIPLTDSSVGIDSDYLALYAGSSFYCPDENGDLVLTHRGQFGRTPWTYNLDASIGYTPEWAGKKLTLEARVFNLLNTQRVTEYYETAQGGSADNQIPEPNYGNIVNYQTPRSVQFSLRYEF